MRSNIADPQQELRPYFTAFVAQLALTLLAVLVSRMELGVRLDALAVMLVAVVNAGLVAVFLMGIRRDGWMVAAIATVTFVLLLGLLIWPAWDISQRARVF